MPALSDPPQAAIAEEPAFARPCRGGRSLLRAKLGAVSLHRADDENQWMALLAGLRAWDLPVQSNPRRCGDRKRWESMSLGSYLRQFATGQVLRLALQKNAPSMIPTSGDRAKENDCYAIYLLDEGGVARFLVNEKDGQEIGGKWSLDGRNFTEDRTISLSELSAFTVYIQHYYRGGTFYTVGVPMFLRYRWSRWPWVLVTFDRFLQARFNRKELTRQDRMKVLDHILAETVRHRSFETTPIDLLTHFYTARWVQRPDMQQLQNYYKLLLESLIVSEDLLPTQHQGYKLVPKALNSVTAFALEERRHGDNTKIQTRIVMLTIALTVFGFVQAGAAAYEQWWKSPETLTGTVGDQPIELIQK